jgi:hypothetical protein
MHPEAPCGIEFDALHERQIKVTRSWFAGIE